VALSSASADALLERALGALSESLVRLEVSSIPVAASEQHPPMIVHLIPVRGAAHDFFVRATAIVIVTPVIFSQVPDAQVLQGLFDLSPAEARIARQIGEGRTVEAIAGAFGVSQNTVRVQLKSVLHKTGLHRQAQLVALLANPLPPGARSAE
jgi:DNA-binding CsgD family transcriptional regulator